MVRKVVSQKKREQKALGDQSEQAREWTFFTNHAHVLITLAMNDNLVLRKIADKVGITERGVQKIIADLCEAGYLKRVRVGRRNEYRLNLKRPLRHSIEQHRTIGDIMKVLNKRS